MPAVHKAAAVREAAARSLESAVSALRRAQSDGSLEAFIAHTASIARRATDEARLTNKNGELSKVRVARAAFRPTRTARRLAVGAVKAAASHALTHGRAAEPK